MTEKNLSIGVLLDFYKELLSTSQSEALHQYYNEDFSLSEIAENLGITRQGVYENIKRGEELLLGFERTLALAEKSRRIGIQLQKITAEAQMLKEHAEGAFTVNAAEKILMLTEEIHRDLQ